MRTHVVAVGFALLVTGCQRSAGFTEQAATRRLTAEEWQNTARDLLGVSVDRSLLPVDELTAGFPNNVSGSLGEFDVENYLLAAEQAAAAATTDVSDRLGCSVPTRACAASWAPGFLEHAFRRPVSADEVDELLTLYDAAGDHAEGVRLMITGALVSGHFLYRPEVRGTRVGARIELDGFEIASRLSYLLWRSMPDDALFDAARAGDLGTPRGIAAEASRLLADPKAGAAVAAFHLDWLGLANASLIDRLPRPEDAVDIQRLSLHDQPLAAWTTDGVLGEGEHGGEPALVVEAGDEAVVAHHGVDLGETFSIRGRLMATDPDAEVGVTFLGGQAADPREYALQRTVDGTFSLSSTAVTGPGGCADTTTLSSGPGAWTEFEIVGRVGNLENTVQVRLWARGDPAPTRPELVCRDETAGRPTRGTVGVRAVGPGEQWWAGLQAQTARPVPFDFGPFAEAYLAETRGFIAEWLHRGGTLSELLTADWTMADETVAAVYGIGGVTGSELRPVSLPPERVGLLTQPLFLSTFAKANQSSPVLRGVAVRSALLCEILVPPPPNVAVIAPDPSPNATTRERFAQHTENPGCAACHVRMDPIGFGFEAFDQLGGYRTEENDRPIDASGEIVGAGTASGTFDDVRGLVDLLAGSDVVRACMVRHWYRQAMAHLEDPRNEDPALLDALDRCEAEGCTLDDVIEALVTGDSFRSRAAHDGDVP